MVYRETVTQAQILSYADDFWLLLVTSCAVLALVPFMQRVRVDRGAPRRRPEPAQPAARDPGLPAPTD
jgi:hypothetical protein